MLNIICTEKPKYIEEEVDSYNYQLYICISCGKTDAGTTRYAPKGTKFAHYICSRCINNEIIPKNIRISRIFYQYYDKNFNLILEKEFNGLPSQ